MSDAADTAVNRSPNRPIRKGDHVFLVDGSSYIFRAYHALPPLTRKSDGLPIGAVAGFCNMLWRLIRDIGGGREADAPRRRLRLLGHDVPQRHVRPVQGAAPRAAGGSAPAVPADPRGGARLRHPLRRAEGLRGRRHHRDLCPRRLRGRRDDHHRGVRQGPDAARRQRRDDVRLHEGKAHRPRRGDREIRRAAREGRRGAGADRRQRRQRARRSRHRREDRRAAHQRIWRPRERCWPASARSASPSGGRR